MNCVRDESCREKLAPSSPSGSNVIDAAITLRIDALFEYFKRTFGLSLKLLVPHRGREFVLWRLGRKVPSLVILKASKTKESRSVFIVSFLLWEIPGLS